MKNTRNKLISMKSFQAIFVMLILLLVTSCSKDEKPEPQTPPDDNNPDNMKTAPAFSLTSLDGGTVSLADLTNKVVVLFFLGNSCPLCKASAPVVESSIHQVYSSNSNVVVLGLDQWDGNAASVTSFKNSTGVTFPLLLNASGVASDYGTTYDRLIVIGKDGKIKFSGNQAARNQAGSVATLIQSLL